MKNIISSKHESFGSWIIPLDGNAILLVISVLILVGGLACMRVHAETHTHSNTTGQPEWTELIRAWRRCTWPWAG